LLDIYAGNKAEKQEGGGGFNVGSTVNACTKGIWLWGAPKRLEEKVRACAMLGMDVPGVC
jgi:hypothetical protein